MNTTFARAAAVTGCLAIATAVAVSCSQAREIGGEIASSASSIGSSAASAAGSAASSAASAASSAASSASSAASSVVSSVLSGAPTTVSAPGGEVALDGPAAEAYQKAGGEAALGQPTGQPQKIGDGTAVAFANGTVYSSPAAGAHVVQGEILRSYLAAGGPAGPLGWPTADETETGGGPSQTNGGWIGEFQNGTITWLNDGSGNFTATVVNK